MLIPGYFGGPSVITRVLLSRQEDERKRTWRETGRCYVTGFGNGRWTHEQRTAMQVAFRNWKK